MKKRISILILAIALPLSIGCEPNRREPIKPASGKKLDGGGEYGGGDVLQIPATPEDIVAMMPRVKAILPYSFNFMEFLHQSMKAEKIDAKASERIDSASMDLPQELNGHKITFAVMKNMGDVLFKKSKDKQDVYDLLKTLKISVLVDKPCKDASGKDKDGSIHGSMKGDICISALRLSKKVKRVHLFNSLLGMVVHEIVHRLGGDKIEAEAKLAEFITRNVPVTYANRFFAIEGKNAIEILQIHARSAIKAMDPGSSIPGTPPKFDETIEQARGQISHFEPLVKQTRKDYDALKKEAEALELDLAQRFPYNFMEPKQGETPKADSDSNLLKEQRDLFKKLARIRESQVITLAEMNMLENMVKVYQNQIENLEIHLQYYEQSRTEIDLRSDEFLCRSLQALTSEVTNTVVQNLAPKPLISLSTLASHDLGLLLAVSSQVSAAEAYCYTESNFDLKFFSEGETWAPASRFHVNAQSDSVYFLNSDGPKIYRVPYQDKAALKKALQIVTQSLDQLIKAIENPLEVSILH